MHQKLAFVLAIDKLTKVDFQKIKQNANLARIAEAKTLGLIDKRHAGDEKFEIREGIFGPL